MGQDGSGGEGSDDLFRLLKRGKEAIGFVRDWSFFLWFFHSVMFALLLFINSPLFLPRFFLSIYHSVHSSLSISAFLPFPISLSLCFCILLFCLSFPTLPVFSFRALFLGLSNNPHITDLHLDISSCEVCSVSSRCSWYIHSSSS